MKNLLWIDYSVFMVVILASVIVTVFRNLSGSKQKTKSSYVFASNRSVSTWPMLVSIARGFLGVRVFLGYPSELYYRGCALWETVYGVVLAFPIVIYCFIPIYLSLGITSVYQYLDMRFKSRLVRCLTSALYSIRSILILGISLFTPCIAIKTIIGVPYSASITGMTLICILFSFTGGFGSALMGDVIQCILMLTICVIVIIQGSIEVGGPLKVIQVASERDRLNFFKFDPDPTKRATTMSSLVGHLFISVSMYACQQNFVQRYVSMGGEQKVKRILFLSMPFTAVLMSLSWIVGMVVFAQYLDCDPKLKQYIQDMDEIFPFYLEDKFSFIPGLMGIFIAVLFNGAVCAVVTNMNSLSTVIWEDFLSDLTIFNNLADKHQVWTLKLIGFICSLIVMAVAFGVSNLTGIVEVSIKVISATGGPLLGIFVLAVFFPSVNWKGASLGMLSSSAFMIWIAIGSLYSSYEPPDVVLPTSTSLCTNETFDADVISHRILTMSEKFSLSPIELTNSTTLLDDSRFGEESFFEPLYRVTYLYYSLMGTIVTVVIGFLHSLITCSKAEEYVYKENLVHPLIRALRPYKPVNLEIS